MGAMRRFLVHFSAVVFLVGLATATAANAQGGPPLAGPSPTVLATGATSEAAGDKAAARDRVVGERARAIESIGTLPPAQSLSALEQDHFTDRLFKGAARDTLLASIAALRPVIAGAGMIALDTRDAAFVLRFEGQRSAEVVFALEDRAPYRITRFVIDLAPAAVSRPAPPALDWDELPARLEQAERDGFSGVVVALRRGATVLERGYGRVDPAQDAQPTTDTVFDIGSMPIDFTRAAVLLLAQQGRLSLNDRIGRFFERVPADKTGITLGHLMDGTSGLPNFHARDGDADKDLSWIDHDAAISRILAQPLLFAPGSDRSPSHSAFGLLAAVVQVVSGQDYGAFLQRVLFDPAGMRRTGFYGQTLGLPDTAFAVGGGRPASVPNIPPRWGRASWLVIGSGGMVSSVADMRRGQEFIAAEKLLRGEWLQRYLAPKLAMGGSARGFLFVRIVGANGDALFLASNTHRGPGEHGHLIESLMGMVLPDRREGPGR